MHREALAIVMILGMGSQPALSAKAVDLHCGANLAAVLPPYGEDIHLRVDSLAKWIELEERGQQVLFASATPGSVIELQAPLRHGWRLLRLDSMEPIVIRRAEPNDARGAVWLSAHCTPIDHFHQLRWVERATAFARTIDRSSDETRLEAFVVVARELVASAPDPKLRAFGMHLSAQMLLMNGRYADSAVAFGHAEMAWNSVGDRARALVARVARVEDEYRVGNYESVLELTVANMYSMTDETAYFLTRLRNTRCLALKATGRMDAAIECYKSTVATYERLDERSEHALALQTYAGALRDAGRLEDAQKVVDRGLRTVTGPDAPLNRGRLLLVAADLTLLRGDVAGSLKRMRDALDYFEVAGVRRWQANAMLGIADLYTRLGALAEAEAFLAQAVELLTPRDSPARMAQAIRLAANLEREAAHADFARVLASAVEWSYRSLDMPAAFDSARLMGLELDLEAGALDRVERAMPPMAERMTLNEVRWALLSAELAMERRRLDVAERELAGLQEKVLSLRDQVRFALLDARYWKESGNAEKSREVLLAMARRIDTLASATRNPVLEHVVRRQAIPLREAGVETGLSDGADVDPVSLLEWLLATSSAMSTTSIPAMEKYGGASEFNAAVARELLARTEGDRRNAEMVAQRELLSFLGKEDSLQGRGTTPATALIGELQRGLDEQTVFVALVEGARHARLLWVADKAVRVMDLGNPDAIRASATDLRRLLMSKNSPIREIESARHRLSTLLFAGVGDKDVPGRLYVLDEGLLGDIPVAALEWPESKKLLLDSTTVSFVRLVPVNAGSQGNAPVAHVFVAAQHGGTAQRLSYLPGAETEATQVGKLLSASGIRVVDAKGGSRAALLNALSESGAWLHVTAHGSADPARIGYSGVWLEPTQAEAQPGFVSWLDALSQAGHADLVVLSACDLAKSGESSGGSTSFATALSMAGARQVVASSWSLSDAATGAWVPAFYARLLSESGRDAATALHQAQRELRLRRAFRHPSYWAGLKIVQRWPVLAVVH